MPTLDTLLLFSLAAFFLAATPGPDMLLIASRSATQGRLAGFATLAGIQLGTYCHALAAALGLSQLLQHVPLAYEALRFAGALYLGWLAWQCFRAKPAPVVSECAVPERMSLQKVFLQGLLTNLLNPKMALFVLALFPQFVQPAAGPLWWQMLLLATVLNMVGLVVNGAVILSASHLARRLGRSGQRWPQWLLGSVFAVLAGRLLLAERG